jgi:hypothetical protein
LRVRDARVGRQAEVGPASLRAPPLREKERLEAQPSARLVGAVALGDALMQFARDPPRTLAFTRRERYVNAAKRVLYRGAQLRVKLGVSGGTLDSAVPLPRREPTRNLERIDSDWREFVSID